MSAMTAAAIDPAMPPMQLLERFGPRRAGEGDERSRPAPTLAESLEYVRGLARTHYENFSVLSALVPRDLRDDFAAVYAFCRWADDLGDETGSTPEARAKSLELLAWWRAELRQCFAAAAGPLEREDAGPSSIPAPSHPVFVALAETVKKRRLALQPFDDLIIAFEQDQRVRYYGTWDEVIDYCRLSANPVGRIVLALAGHHDTPENAERYRLSDATCTALQLINHWQDVRRDLLERDRVYVPSDDTKVTPEMLRDWAARPEDAAARIPYIRMLRALVDRTRPLFIEGRALIPLLDPRIRPVVWLFGAGGERLMKNVERAGCTTLWTRPTLGAAEKLGLVARAWIWRRVAPGGRGGETTPSAGRPT